MLFRKNLLVFILVLSAAQVIGQNNSLILRDQVAINIENGAVLVIAQSNASGIVRTGSANGVIVSEAETDRVAWIINNGSGAYTIPFGKNLTTQIPMTYTITGAGSTPGTLVASTYPTAWQNTPMPSVYAPVVTTMTMDYPTSNLSAYVADRFWVLRSNSDWATRPTSTLSLTYDDVEWTTASNTITEANLLAQYWNNTQWNPGWYTGSPLLGVNNAASNNVNAINATSGGNLYTWILVDNTNPLPVELLDFSISCTENAQPEINWSTATETNNAGFEVERSADGISWEYVSFVSGAGNSNTPLYYSYTDYNAPAGSMYYRLYQRDFDGTITPLGMQQVNCQSQSSDVIFDMNVYSDMEHQVFVTFSSYEEQSLQFEVLDARGRLVFSRMVQANAGTNQFEPEWTPLSDAIYFFRLSGNDFQMSKKFFLQ